MKKLRIFLVFLIAFPVLDTKAQSFYEHEFSLNVGVFQLRSDYGVRDDNETNFGNQGTAISLSYYYNPAFLRSDYFFNKYFKYRLNLMYSSVNLQHYGPFVDDPRLEAMTGSYKNFTISNGLEFYPLKIKTQKLYQAGGFFNDFLPFLGVGIGVNFVTPEAVSSLDGGLSNIDNIFPTFISETSDNGINVEKQTVLSLNLRAGLRYKMNIQSELVLESGWMFFNSDFVDGLSPVGPQNKSSDWSWGINLGYSYLLF